MRIGLAGTGRIGSFHAATLASLATVDELVLFDPDLTAAGRLAERLNATGTAQVRVVPDLADLLAAGIEGFVITSGTHTHADLLRAGIAAGVPTFCEKPVDTSFAGTLALARLEADSEVPVQIGFQRRFDVGYRRIRDAVAAGELGFLHTIRATTNDQSPPPASYVPTSGGLLRDCSVHDFDIIRFVTGAEVRSVYAAGANRGDRFFTEGGDVDTAAALLTLDNDVLALVSATRYNGAGHDVRLEVHGSAGTLAAGLDDSLALTSAEDGVAFPPGPVHTTYMERFATAYAAELTAFTDLVRGAAPSPCRIADALQAFRTAEAATLSREQGRVVALEEIPDWREQIPAR